MEGFLRREVLCCQGVSSVWRICLLAAPRSSLSRTYFAGEVRQGRFALRQLLFRRCRKQSFLYRLLSGLLASPANGLGFFAGLSLRRLLIGASLLHLAEDALALHL